MSNATLEDKLRALEAESEPYWPDGYPFKLGDLLRAAAALGADAAYEECENLPVSQLNLTNTPLTWHDGVKAYQSAIRARRAATDGGE